ncbi:MAG: chorismate synthase [Salinivirgaceae bacterium]|nr:chorismate synthase [Salinivirgaceae bacterium]MDD4746519.1 chorismate synthase [Salinivirgaceae bacterium]MDY0279420.1 chorismate synthase [Salinivirgaceae bacterium]
MNRFGENFRLSIFGESHGEFIGITIDGLNAGMALGVNDFESDIQRRKAGGKGTTARIESDIPNIVSGVYRGFTTGAPLTIFFRNENVKSSDYRNFADIPRPGHADFTASAKYGGFNDARGGGHHSGRMTLALVAAGVIAKKIISPILITTKIETVHGENDIESAVQKATDQGDSVGGIVSCSGVNIPIGLGEPFFNSVESVISQLIFSIPAIKGIEFGSGFSSAFKFGSENNDVFINSQGKTTTNNSGGILGGITNGNELFFKVAVKPTSSISKPQSTHNFNTNLQEDFVVEGRHDACIALRIPVVVEAVTAIALAELLLQKTTFIE